MEDVLGCLFLKLICIKDRRINICLLFLELNLYTKESTANERTHLHIFIKFMKKN